MNVVEEAKKLISQLAGLSRDAIKDLLAPQSQEVRDAVYKLRFEAFFANENEQAGSRKEHTSPSGKYTLITSSYTTGPGTWNYSRGLARLSGSLSGSEKPIADVKRNYGSFPFSWIEGHVNGHDYLVCGSDYQGQTIIELDTGLRIDNIPKSAAAGCGFCWAAHHPNANGTLLAVEGCFWAAPFETVIYDFSEPMAPPWPELHRGDSDFDGWTGLNSCKVGTSRTLFTPADDASDGLKALAGKTMDDLTTEQLEMIEAEETRLGRELWQDKIVSQEWIRPSAVDIVKKLATDSLGWWKEQNDDPVKYPRPVKPAAVADQLAVIDKMINRLSERDLAALHADPACGPLLAWKEQWAAG